MKKSILLVVLSFALITASNAQKSNINVSGNVSGVWNYDTVFVNDDISIQAGNLLTIEPGVQVVFSDHFKFNIYGRLLAIGTSYDTIVFTALDTIVGWHGLRFFDINTNGQDSSKIVYCKFEYGKATGIDDDKNGGAIYCNNSSEILIRNSLIKENSAAMYGGGIHLTSNSSPSLCYVAIIGNSTMGYSYGYGYGGGISCSDGSNPSLNYVTITKNSVLGVFSGYGGGIYCFSNSNPIISNSTIKGNSVSGSYEYGGGSYFSTNSNPIMENVIITENSASGKYGYGGGICCYTNSNPTMTNVTITGNSASGGHGYGGGIYCYTSSLSLENVTITGNSALNEGGAIHFNASNANFDTSNRSNIFFNHASVGNDVSAYNCPIIDITIDTFTVVQPVNYFAYPINNFTFDILNGKVEQENHDLYVSPIGSDENSGLTVENPLLSISYALVKIIADSINPHTIHLSNGTYSSSMTGEIFPLNCRSYVSFRGMAEDSVILDGEGINGVLHCYKNNNLIIEGMTILNGNTYYGGGIYCEDSSPNLKYISLIGNSAIYNYGGGGDGGGISCTSNSSPSLYHVAIIDNSASYGGGVYCSSSSSMSLENVIIKSNTATNGTHGWGGGIYCSSTSSSSWHNVIISENSTFGTYSYGGGIYCNGTSPSLDSVIIKSNSSSGNLSYGGGIYCSSSSPSLTNVTITFNSADKNGGGIYCNYNSSPSLENVTIANNIANDNGGGIYSYNSSPSLLNCIIWNDTPQEIYSFGDTVIAAYSDIQGGWTGSGNIDSDPLFANPANDDFHLTWNNYPTEDSTKSHCIDTGDPDPQYNDPDGTRNDMGAYYFVLNLFFQVNLKVFLEGPFNVIDMSTDLNTDYIPLLQPFNTTPWNYDGSESVSSIPNTNIVDWVLIELRDAVDASSADENTIIERKAGFILKDGTIVNLNGISNLSFSTPISQNLFVVVYHRNHLPIMSSIPITETDGIFSYDFSTGSYKAFGGSLAQKELTPGVWGMIAADGNADGQIDNQDKNDIWLLQNGNSGYLEGDLNMNGNVDSQDKPIWESNAGKGTQIPN